MKVKKVSRPWGEFKRFALNEKCTVKILEVGSGQELSLQKHRKRKEVWYFLDAGVVEIGKRRKKVREGDVVNVLKNQAHRIIAYSGKVRVLEISFGKFDEKDEIRLEDRYGRCK